MKHACIPGVGANRGHGLPRLDSAGLGLVGQVAVAAIHGDAGPHEPHQERER
jgi:hypothetical protein